MIFLRIWKGSFFDGFRDRKKWVQNLENLTKVIPRGDCRESEPAEPRQRRGRGEVNLPPGSEGSEDQRLRGKKVRRIGRKEGSEVQKERKFRSSEAQTNAGDSKRRPDGSADCNHCVLLLSLRN